MGYFYSIYNNITSINYSELHLPIITAVVILIFLLVLRTVWSFIASIRSKYVYLELTPPANIEKTAYTTQQLFSVLHNLGSQKTLRDKLLGRKDLFSFEIVSTREQGIRYVIRVDENNADTVQRTIVSYLPHVKVKRKAEYLPNQINNFKIVEFKLRKHYAFPLAKQNILEEHDPVAYISGMMTKLAPEELMSMQLVVSPTKTKECEIVSRKILHNEDVLKYLSSFHLPIYLQPVTLAFTLVVKILSSLSNTIINTASEIVHGASNYQLRMNQYTLYQNQIHTANIRPARVLSAFEQEVLKSIQEKVEQPLFETSIRVLIHMKNKEELQQRVKGIKSSLAPFSVPNYQSFKSSFTLPIQLIEDIKYLLFKNRLLTLITNTSSSLLSVSEIAALYHFPFATVTQTENIVKVHSKELPAPLSLKKDLEKLNTIFAKNTYGGSTTMIGLRADERRRHMYIIGATGTGKSTLILSMIDSDLKKNNNIAVVDPHGELAEAALASVPDHRISNVIYFNPDDLKYPIGINLMELTPGLDEEDTLREKEFIAESVISLFRKVFSSSMTGSPHRIEYILRNTIHTAFTVENPTLFTIFDLLNDPVFQRKVVKNLQDENLKNFWKNEFGKAGDYQKVKMVSPVTARIGRFLFSPSAKRILEQHKSTINFDEILNGKILICNLAKGKLGEDTSQVLGIMILNKLQLAALKRARVPSDKRKDFYLYVDEFQNFATRSFAEMLSESRKYKLNLIMAEQSTSQQSERELTHVILANAGTVVTFKSANPEDEKLMLPQYYPYIKQGEIANLPAFHFYMKIAALHPEEPFSGETILLEQNQEQNNLSAIIQSSRKNYAIEFKDHSVPPQVTPLTLENKQEKSTIKKDKQKSISGVLPEFA